MPLFGSPSWKRTTDVGYVYYRRSAESLWRANEVLKGLQAVPGMTYYLVDTPDGSLGRDSNGYFTQAPLKTHGLVVKDRKGTNAPVECSRLQVFGDSKMNASAVAQARTSGGYASLVLLMQCGNCGYESPVETEAGPFTRECYRCGAQNTGRRAGIDVVFRGRPVQI